MYLENNSYLWWKSAFSLFFSLYLQAVLNFPKYCEPVVKGEGNYVILLINICFEMISVRSAFLKFSPFWSSKWTWYSQTLEKYWTSFEESHADCLSQGNIKVTFCLLCIIFLSLVWIFYLLKCTCFPLPSSC